MQRTANFSVAQHRTPVLSREHQVNVNSREGLRHSVNMWLRFVSAVYDGFGLVAILFVPDTTRSGLLTSVGLLPKVAVATLGWRAQSLRDNPERDLQAHPVG